MKKVSDLEKSKSSIETIVDLTSVFESIASMKIAKVKNQVLQSTEFFNDLWNIYAQLRVDSLFRFGRSGKDEIIKKELIIAITSEGGFSGDIDQKLIEKVLENYDEQKNDIVVIGHHGALLLAQRDKSYKRYYKIPEKDQNINVSPMIKLVQSYKNTVVYHQEYVSLSRQEVKKIELSKAVIDKGDKAEKNPDLISEENYIFEPNVYAVVGHLERSMLQIALSQLILSSKLAQYASRFNAMTVASKNATQTLENVTLQYNRGIRAEKDERLKEIVGGLKKMRIN